MAIVDRGRLVDGVTTLVGGMDSGRSPSTLPPDQCAYAGNVAFRGGFAKTRPSFKKINITGFSTPEAAKFQGCGYFDYSDGQIILVAGGNIYKIEPPSSGYDWACTDITNSKPLSATRERVHMVQAENKIGSGSATSHIIIQDGSSSPYIWDGSSASYASDTTNSVPVGTGPMAFGHGRLWVAKGRSYVAGDIYGGSNGTLKFTENTYLAGGGSFSVPVSAGSITAMKFAAAPNTALGQGELIVATDDAVFTVNAPLDRSTWGATTDPVQRVALINNGAMSHFSTELVNGDIFMRSRDGIRSVIQAVRDFNQLGNTPISSEMHRIFKYDDAQYLKHASGVLFDNRYLLTTQGVSDTAKGVAYKGLVSLDFNQISSMKGKAPPAYDGYWDMLITRSSVDYELEFYQMVKGRFHGVERCFAFVRSKNKSTGALGDIEVWELMGDDGTVIKDTDVASDGTETGNKITAELETPSFDFNQIGAAKILESADLWVDQLSGGTTTFHADYHPDQYPCWVNWQDWSVTAESSSSSCDDLLQYEKQYRPRMRLGTPDNAEEPAVGKPFNYGWEFAARLKWKGHARIKLFRLNTRETQEEPYADVNIDADSKAVSCDCLGGVSSATNK